MGREFLPPIESLMLATLLAARGTVVPKETLKHEAWGLNAVSDNAFHRKLFELRRAVQSVSKDVSIRSLYGRGIVLDTSLSGEDDLSEFHPNVSRPDIFPELRNLTEDDVYNVAAYLLVAPRLDERWGGTIYF
jgi:DNA-binding winged helix-turn-helix (wHTH) protein